MVKNSKMKISRKNINTKRYILVFFVTVFVFLIGNLVGMSLENTRNIYIYEKIKESNFDIGELTSLGNVMNYLIENERNMSCSDLKKIFLTSLDYLSYTEKKILSFSKQTEYTIEDFSDLKKVYNEKVISFWLLSQKINSICEEKLNTIIYFYSNLNCDNCEEQGIYLDYLKKKYKQDILIFSLDMDLQSTSSGILKEVYFEKKEYPLLYINGKSYEYLNIEEIEKIVFN